MMRNNNRIIEITAATMAIAILFVVMVPEFVKAQQLTYVSQTLRDMAAIAQAMQTYNLDQASEVPAHRLQRAMINDTIRVSSKAPRHRLNTFNTNWKLTPNESFLSLPYRSTFNTDLLSPTYKADAEPPLRGKYLYREGEYNATYHVISNPAIDIDKLQSPLSSFGQSWGARLFRNVSNPSAFLGYCRGPYYGLPKSNQPFDHLKYNNNWFLVTQGKTAIKIWGKMKFKDERVEYSPTNGVESHGYVVYRSAAPATESVEDYFPGLKIEATENPYLDQIKDETKTHH